MKPAKSLCMNNKHLVLMTVLGITQFTPLASAQTAERLIEEVLVTAQKKSAAESVQDVPISISAYSGNTIDAMFATTLTDIGLTAPNVNLVPITMPGVANFVIRGMGTVGQSIPSADPAVGVVMDGISYGTIYGVVTDVFDLQSVEVLRGPQGTLFGRNVTGGVVNMRSNRPTDELEGKVRATVGNYDRVDVAGSVSGPIGSNWGGKLAVLTTDREGLYDNGNLGGEAGEADSLLVRPALSYFGDGFDATLIMEYGDMGGDGTAVRTPWVDGELIADPYGDHTTEQNHNGNNDLTWYNLMLEANWDIWEGRLTSVLGYRDLNQEFIVDVDGYVDDRFLFADGTEMDQDQASLEVRWDGSLTDSVTLTTGIYLFEQEYTYSERRILVNAVDRRGVSMVDHSTQGIFAQSDISLTDNLILTLGGRYTWEQKDADIGLIGDPNATGNCATQGPPFAEKVSSLSDCEQVFEDDNDWSNFTPKVGLTWDITADVMAYASYTRGFRSGGYNVRFTDLSYVSDNPASTPGPYDEEIVDAYEIGFKSTMLEGRARLNAAAFFNDYEDLQRTALNASGGQQILNAATAEIQGIEVDGVVLITENLAFEGSVGWLDASYDEFDAITDATGIRAGDLEFVMAPELTTHAAFTYDMGLADWGNLAWRVAYSYVDEAYVNDANTLTVDQYELWDASVTFSSDNGNVEVSLFGRNLKDEVYYHFGTDFSGSSLAVQSYWLNPPRTYGAEVTYLF